MSELHYRHATESDLPFIVEVYNSIIPLRTVTADTVPITVESRKDWLRAHDHEYRPILIVSDDHEEVGWVSFSDFVSRPAYAGTSELSIYLSEQSRGRGYGKQILQYSIKLAPDLGISTLLALIFLRNKASLKLFINLGFEEWGSLPAVAELDGYQEDLKILGKRV